MFQPIKSPGDLCLSHKPHLLYTEQVRCRDTQKKDGHYISKSVFNQSSSGESILPRKSRYLKVYNVLQQYIHVDTYVDPVEIFTYTRMYSMRLWDRHQLLANSINISDHSHCH